MLKQQTLLRIAYLLIKELFILQGTGTSTYMHARDSMLWQSLSYLFVFIYTSEVVEAHRKGSPLPFIANTLPLYVNWISRLLLTFVKPKGGRQIKPSCFTGASLLSYNARSC